MLIALKKETVYKTGKKQKKSSHLKLEKKTKETINEKKKTMQEAVCKTGNKNIKPLANVSKKAAVRHVDLAKAHVNAKKAGKVVSAELSH